MANFPWLMKVVTEVGWGEADRKNQKKIGSSMREK